jgi:hypothetical protein
MKPQESNSLGQTLVDHFMRSQASIEAPCQLVHLSLPVTPKHGYSWLYHVIPFYRIQCILYIYIRITN